MNAKDLLVFFSERWKEKHDGKAYPISWGREGAMFKRLLTFYSGDDLRAFIVHYFRSDSDPSGFSTRAGYSVAVFVSQVPRLVSELERHAQSETTKAATKSDAQRLEEARKAIRG